MVNRRLRSHTESCVVRYTLTRLVGYTTDWEFHPTLKETSQSIVESFSNCNKKYEQNLKRIVYNRS